MQKIDDLLCFSLYAASNAMTRVYQPLLAPLGLTYPQYLVLVSLWEVDAQLVGALGEKLGLASNTLTPLLKRMETARLISRNRHPGDERKVVIRLAAKGRTLQKKTRDIPACIFNATHLNLPEGMALKAQIETLRRQLVLSLSSA